MSLSQKKSGRANQKYLLQVEDSQDDRLLTQKALLTCQVGADQIIQMDGPQALNFLFSRLTSSRRRHRQNPSVIISDINLPGVDGFQILASIRSDRRTSRIPVVMFTSSDENADRARAFELGADQYYQKPMSFNGFQAIMRKICSDWLDGNLQAADSR